MVNEKDITELLRNRIISSNQYLKGDQEFYVAAASLDKRGRIIAIGFNSPEKTHPLMKWYCQNLNNHKIYLHAEISALVKSQRRIDTLVVVRVNKHRQMALAKPCPVCQLAIQDAQIRTVFYTRNESTIGKQKYG